MLIICFVDSSDPVASTTQVKNAADDDDDDLDGLAHTRDDKRCVIGILRRQEGGRIFGRKR